MRANRNRIVGGRGHGDFFSSHLSFLPRSRFQFFKKTMRNSLKNRNFKCDVTISWLS